MVKYKLTKCFLIMLQILIALSGPKLLIAGWLGPYEVVNGNWGSGDGQFGFVAGDPTDGFPRNFLVDAHGHIIAADSFNKRVQIYKDNELKNTFTYKNLNPGWKIRLWPSDTIANYDSFFIDGGFIPFQFYDYKGSLVRELTIPDCILKKVSQDGKLIVFNYKIKVYSQYSPTGEMLKTYKVKPFELGIVESQSLGNGHYRTTIKYPDLTYTINRHDHDSYVRGCGNVLNGMSNRRIQMYDVNGELIDEFIQPEDKWKITRPAGGGFDERSEVIEQFGSPVIAPNGDIYCWKRTPDTYSILKWVWVEGPDAPEVLSAESSYDRLKVRWRPPAGKAKAIEKFEVIRSNDLCGPYQAIAKVNGDRFIYTDTDVGKGVVYFYRVRALLSSGASGYSNTLAGNVE